MYRPNLGEPVLNQKLSVHTQGILSICGMVLFIALVFIYSYWVNNSLRKNMIVFKGYVSSISHSGKSGWGVNYLYSVNNHIYTGRGSLPHFKNNNDKDILVEKYFPIVIDSTDFTNVDMLFDSLSFAHYRLQYPDSLRWLKEYLR